MIFVNNPHGCSRINKNADPIKSSLCNPSVIAAHLLLLIVIILKTPTLLSFLIDLFLICMIKSTMLFRVTCIQITSL